MKDIHIAAIAAVISLGLLAGCKSESDKQPAVSGQQKAPAVSAAQKAEPALYTAQEAFTRLMGAARLWAADALPFHLESSLSSESSGMNGKSAIWRGLFISASRRSVKTFVCSGSRAAGAPPFGISSTSELAPDPSAAALAFQPFYLKTDSDKAFELAQLHGGASLVKKDPNQPITYVLEWSPAQGVPLWYVIYGKDRRSAKGIGVINATTGTFVGSIK